MQIKMDMIAEYSLLIFTGYLHRHTRNRTPPLLAHLQLQLQQLDLSIMPVPESTKLAMRYLMIGLSRVKPRSVSVMLPLCFAPMVLDSVELDQSVIKLANLMQQRRSFCIWIQT